MSTDLLKIPSADKSVYNELALDGGSPRAHWLPFVDALRNIGSEELARRWERAERRIRENGVTYNVYSDPLGKSRSWAIDPVPLLVPPQEWRFIEAGIIQRAELLNLILQDIYGERRLISSGDLPAALLFANPAFLRPLAGIKVPPAACLHLLAVDLARSPDGQWWVLADRTQAPSGSGYALENRTIVSDVLPDVFRQSNVRRLATFFRAQRDALLALGRSDNPQVVLLTPGPFNETYFEHSYLARYLSFPLVEGEDLTVRDRKVFLKTVEGLRPVDVILRRVDDGFCDPLELRGDSLLGVPGLVEAVNAGSVAVANALGSGVIETPAIMPFLPALSRQLLGEALRLPSVATWWCGQDHALKWVLEHLKEVVVKPAFPHHGLEPIFGAAMAKGESRRISDQVRAKPYDYVAQEHVALSSAPVWDRGRWYWRSLVLRTYVVNTGQGWIAMPGGLVRVAGAEGPVVSMQKGGHSKDAWVLAEGPVDTFSMLRPRHQPVELRRGSTELPSRAADNLFWLGRYAERCECIARLLRCLITRVRQVRGPELSGLFRLYACFSTPAGMLPRDRPATPRELEAELISLMSDAQRPDSLAATLAEVQRVGGHLRERLSTDMSRLVGQLAEAGGVEKYMLFVEYSGVLNGCLELLAAFSGMERENITRGNGWLFMSLGRRLERAIYSVRQLRELNAPFEESSWPLLEYLLEVADSSMTYRSRYFTTLQPVAVLDVLMTDNTNPRSLVFQLTHLADLYRKLPRYDPEDSKAMQHATAMINNLDLSALDYPLPGADRSAANEKGRIELDRSLAYVQDLLPSWADNVSSTYFDHARAFPTSIGG